MMLKNKFLLDFCLFIGSCALKAQDIVWCEESYQKDELRDCYNCSKEYLASNPTDLGAMALIVKCAQSQEELEYVNQYMKLAYNNHTDLYEKSGTFWIANGDLHMKLADSMRANASYLLARNIDSSFIGINYKVALSSLACYRENGKYNGYYSDTERNFTLEKIIYSLNRELINNPNDSATLALKKEVENILGKLI